MWDMDTLCRTAAETLQEAGDQLDLEGAVRGLDAVDELALHPLLADALLRCGFGVERERPYPGDVHARRRHSQRERCDLVVLPSPMHFLLDPVAELLATDAARGTLFADVEPEPDTLGVAAANACWIEVKVVGQFCFRDGVPGPNSAYSSELTAALTDDLAKLSRDALLRHSAVLLVLFTESVDVAEHDVTVALHRAIDRGVPLRSPTAHRFAVQDRIGNRVCSVVLVPSGRL
jgi:hypothetical protein